MECNSQKEAGLKADGKVVFKLAQSKCHNDAGSFVATQVLEQHAKCMRKHALNAANEG